MFLRLRSLRCVSWLLILGATVYALPATCRAQAAPTPPSCCFSLSGIGPSGGEVAAALIGAGAVIGVGTYFLARAPRLTGCVVSQGGALGLQETAAGDPMYLLEGETSGLHAGERVKVIGRKHRMRITRGF